MEWIRSQLILEWRKYSSWESIKNNVSYARIKPMMRFIDALLNYLEKISKHRLLLLRIFIIFGMQFYASLISLVKVSPHKFGKGISMQIYSFLVYLCSCTTTKNMDSGTRSKPLLSHASPMVIILFFSFCFSKVNPIFTGFLHRLCSDWRMALRRNQSLKKEWIPCQKMRIQHQEVVLCTIQKKNQLKFVAWISSFFCHWCPHRLQPIAKHHYVQVFLAFDAYYASHTWENPIQGRIMHMIHSSHPDDCYSRNFGHVLKHEICLIRCVIMRFLFAMNHHNKFLVATRIAWELNEK